MAGVFGILAEPFAPFGRTIGAIPASVYSLIFML